LQDATWCRVERMCWEQRNAVGGSSRSNTPVTPQPSAIWGRVVACLSLCYQNVLGAWNVRGRKVEAVVSTVAFLRRRATASPRRRIVALSHRPSRRKKSRSYRIRENGQCPVASVVVLVHVLTKTRRHDRVVGTPAIDDIKFSPCVFR
jgi:hypothetical protein